MTCEVIGNINMYAQKENDCNHNLTNRSIYGRQYDKDIDMYVVALHGLHNY